MYGRRVPPLGPTDPEGLALQDVDEWSNFFAGLVDAYSTKPHGLYPSMPEDNPVLLVQAHKLAEMVTEARGNSSMFLSCHC